MGYYLIFSDISSDLEAVNQALQLRVCKGIELCEKLFNWISAFLSQIYTELYV